MMMKDSPVRISDSGNLTCRAGDFFGRITNINAVRLGVAPLTLLACESEGADALARSVAAGGAVDLVDPRSIARSTVDTSVGRLAIEAASRDGGPVVVSDQAIVAATRALAAKGFYVETSSALALAGIR